MAFLDDATKVIEASGLSLQEKKELLKLAEQIDKDEDALALADWAQVGETRIRFAVQDAQGSLQFLFPYGQGDRNV